MSQEPDSPDSERSAEPPPSAPLADGAAASAASAAADATEATAEPVDTTRATDAADPADPADPAEQSADLSTEPGTEQSGGQSSGKRRLALTIGIGGGVAALALVIGAGFAAVYLFGEDPPEVGDCLTQAVNADDMSVVDCDSGDAYWTVVANDGNWTHGEFEDAPPGEVCADHLSTQQALWVTGSRNVADDTEGEVVCLEPLAGDSGAGA